MEIVCENRRVKRDERAGGVEEKVKQLTTFTFSTNNINTHHLSDERGVSWCLYSVIQ